MAVKEIGMAEVPLPEGYAGNLTDEQDKKLKSLWLDVSKRKKEIFESLKECTYTDPTSSFSFYSSSNAARKQAEAKQKVMVKAYKKKKHQMQKIREFQKEMKQKKKPKNKKKKQQWKHYKKNTVQNLYVTLFGV